MKSGNHTQRVSLPVDGGPSRLDWIVAIFVLIIQQNAFVLTPLVLRDLSTSELRDVPKSLQYGRHRRKCLIAWDRLLSLDKTGWRSGCAQ